MRQVLSQLDTLVDLIAVALALPLADMEIRRE